VAPLRRRFGGSITPTIKWILYADDLVAPLRRRSGGAITPTMEWLLYADDSHLRSKSCAVPGFQVIGIEQDRLPGLALQHAAKQAIRLRFDVHSGLPDNSNDCTGLLSIPGQVHGRASCLATKISSG
jgi:hypothetical protein